MRKFLIILLLPSFLTISKVVSTEKEVVYTSKEIYYLSQSDFGIYFREKLSSPMVYGEVPVYANEDLVVESGKLTPKTNNPKNTIKPSVKIFAVAKDKLVFL